MMGRYRRAVARGALGAALALMAGCGSVPKAPPHAEVPMPAPPAEVVIEPGDVLEVKYVFWPELDLMQTVRADGRVALPYLGDVEVAGKRPGALRDELLARYADRLKDPEITVIARTEESRRVYVAGHVTLPGVVALAGRMTVFEAVMAAGGFLPDSARISNVLVVRRIDGRLHARTVDLRPAFKEAESEAFYLENRDAVYVPQSPIARLDQWVDQYINELVPRSVYFNLNTLWEDDGDDRGGTTYVTTGAAGTALR